MTNSSTAGKVAVWNQVDLAYADNYHSDDPLDVLDRLVLLRQYALLQSTAQACRPPHTCSFKCEFLDIDKEHFICIQSGNYHRCTERACRFIVYTSLPYCSLTIKSYEHYDEDLFDETGQRRNPKVCLSGGQSSGGDASASRLQSTMNEETQKSKAVLSDDGSARRRLLRIMDDIRLYKDGHVSRYIGWKQEPPRKICTIGQTDDDADCKRPRKRRRTSEHPTDSGSSVQSARKHINTDEQVLYSDARLLVKTIFSLKADERIATPYTYVLRPTMQQHIIAIIVKVWLYIQNLAVQQNKKLAKHDFKYTCVYIICNCLQRGLTTMDNQVLVKPLTLLPGEKLPDRKVLRALSMEATKYTAVDKLVCGLLCTPSTVHSDRPPVQHQDRPMSLRDFGKNGADFI